MATKIDKPMTLTSTLLAELKAASFPNTPPEGWATSDQMRDALGYVSITGVRERLKKLGVSRMRLTAHRDAWNIAEAIEAMKNE